MAQKGGQRPFADGRANGEVAPIAVIRRNRDRTDGVDH
jgi:hypothetical protein